MGTMATRRSLNPCPQLPFSAISSLWSAVMTM